MSLRFKAFRRESRLFSASINHNGPVGAIQNGHYRGGCHFKDNPYDVDGKLLEEFVGNNCYSNLDRIDDENYDVFPVCS